MVHTTEYTFKVNGNIAGITNNEGWKPLVFKTHKEVTDYVAMTRKPGEHVDIMHRRVVTHDWFLTTS